jgi:hypothetical protein
MVPVGVLPLLQIVTVVPIDAPQCGGTIGWALLDTPQTPGDGLEGVINADLGKLGGCPRIGFSSNAPPHANLSGCRDNNTPANTEVLLCAPKVRRISSVKVAFCIPDVSAADAE